MHADDDSLYEGPSDADLAEEAGAVKCVHCGRLMLEDADLCPYCKHWQTDELGRMPRKPLWFVLTVILCVAALSGVLGISAALMYGWRP
jgi:hypothetical protein